MEQKSIADAVKQICDEKGITVESVIETIEAALAAAYRKDFGEKNQNIKVEFDLETGKSKVFDEKIVVEDMPEEELEALEAEETEEKEKAKEKKSKTQSLPAEALAKAGPKPTRLDESKTRRGGGLECMGEVCYKKMRGQRAVFLSDPKSLDKLCQYANIRIGISRR